MAIRIIVPPDYQDMRQRYNQDYYKMKEVLKVSTVIKSIPINEIPDVAKYIESALHSADPLLSALLAPKISAMAYSETYSFDNCTFKVDGGLFSNDDHGSLLKVRCLRKAGQLYMAVGCARVLASRNNFFAFIEETFGDAIKMTDKDMEKLLLSICIADMQRLDAAGILAIAEE